MNTCWSEACPRLCPYVETHDLSKVDNVKRNILRLYRQDISKHGGSDRIRITRIFDNLVGQLSKKEKKFNITSLGEKAKTRDYEDAFFWLSDAFSLPTTVSIPPIRAWA